jgi:Mn-dependent DtxR family transcriptional regulator
LTNEGLQVAESISKNYDIFQKFLEIILVPDETAIKDANILQHKLDEKTIIQFGKFVKFMTLEQMGVTKKWRKIFKYYSDQEGE